MKERFCLKGLSPERALTRLFRLGVTVYSAQKIDKTSVVFTTKRKDKDKVLSTYPKGGVYEVTKLPPQGLTGVWAWCKKRTGVVLGGLLFVATTCFADSRILRIQIDAPAVYIAKVQETLQEKGVAKYAAYHKDKEREICGQLLALDGVSYCSVQKRGSVLIVTLKTNAFYKTSEREELYAEREGVVEKLVLLSGTPLVKEGDMVKAGDKLVEGAIYSQDGERKEIAVVAYAVLACTYEDGCEAKDEREAFAKAYLAAGLEDSRAKLTQSSIEKEGERYAVSLSYTWTQRLWI